MADWLSYSLSDFLMFSQETYARLFVRLDAAYPLARWVGTGLGLGLILSAYRGSLSRGGLILLGLIWAWVGWAFFGFYAEIMAAATYLAWIFYGQAALLVLTAVKRRHGISGSPYPYLRQGALVLSVAIVVGYGFLSPESFALTPTPTALATLTLFAVLRAPLWLWPLPVAWLLIHILTQAALSQAP